MPLLTEYPTMEEVARHDGLMRVVQRGQASVNLWKSALNRWYLTPNSHRCLRKHRINDTPHFAAKATHHVDFYSFHACWWWRFGNNPDPGPVEAVVAFTLDRSLMFHLDVHVRFSKGQAIIDHAQMFGSVGLYDEFKGVGGDERLEACQFLFGSEECPPTANRLVQATTHLDFLFDRLDREFKAAEVMESLSSGGET